MTVLTSEGGKVTRTKGYSGYDLARQHGRVNVVHPSVTYRAGRGYSPGKAVGVAGSIKKGDGLTQLGNIAAEATGIAGATRTYTGNAQGWSDYVDAVTLPAAIALEVGAAAAPETGGLSEVGVNAGLIGFRQGVRQGIPIVARALDPGVGILKGAPGTIARNWNRTGDVAENAVRRAGSRASDIVKGAAHAIEMGGPPPATAIVGVGSKGAAVAGGTNDWLSMARKAAQATKAGSQVSHMQADGGTWGSVRGARPKPAEAHSWEQGFEPLDLTVNGRTGAMSAETYKTAKAHYGNDFPDAEIIGDTAYLAPKMKKSADKLLKDIPHNLISPVSAKQINKTSLDGVIRINDQYAKDSQATSILDSYGIKRSDPSVAPVTKESVAKMRKTFESDYGQAYRYDPVTGAERITNNEHVFSVSAEALRHNFEIRQLEASMKAEKLGYLARQKEMAKLVSRQKQEMEVALDPNQSMLLLSEGTNQKIVGALPPEAKIKAIGEHDTGGALGVTVPYRSGEERNWFPNMATNTISAYQDVINNAARQAPSLVSKTADGFRQDYATMVKPLRNSLQNAKDPKLVSELQKKIKQAENELYNKYYS